MSWDTFSTWIFNLGLFWAVGAAEKKIQTAINNHAVFEGNILCFLGQNRLPLESQILMYVITWGQEEASGTCSVRKDDMQQCDKIISERAFLFSVELLIVVMAIVQTTYLWDMGLQCLP